MKKLFTFLFITLSVQLLAQDALEQKILETMKKYDAVGLAVSVIKNNQPVYEKAFGEKNRETHEHLQTNDLFRIASISKSFSATSIMQLVEQGKLHLDDDISDLIGFKVRNPKYPEVKITLKMMLSHTSSLNDSQGYFELKTINPSTNPDWQKCYNDYIPGTNYEYCNLNFNIIGTVIEKVSGERFDNYVRNHILRPLNLYGGYCVDSLDSKLLTPLYNTDNGDYELSPTAYHPRREEIQNYVFGYSTPVFSPTGGMKISAPDLAKYMTMHMNYGKLGKIRIISKKSSKLMQTPVNQESGYGLALLKNNKIIPGVTLTGHTGSAYGLYSYMFFIPQKKFGVVLITNGCKKCDTEPTNTLLSEVTRILYSEFNK